MTFAFPTLRVALTALLACGLPNMVAAQDWIFRFTQDAPAAITVTGFDSRETLACPDHFRPARLAQTYSLTELGTLTFEQDLPRVLNENSVDRFDRRRTDANDRLTLTLALTACVLHNHVLPQSGTVTLAGDFGVGQLDTLEFDVAPTNAPQGLRLDYVAHLAGQPNTDDAAFGESQTLGTLNLAFRSIQRPITAPDGRVGEGFVGPITLRLHVLIEEENA